MKKLPTIIMTSVCDCNIVKLQLHRDYGLYKIKFVSFSIITTKSIEFKKKGKKNHKYNSLETRFDLLGPSLLKSSRFKTCNNKFKPQNVEKNIYIE